MTQPAPAPANLHLAERLSEIVLYQIYPQSFADSNGDGVGDLPGITSRLDYLSWLGVDAIWLSPCFVSPFDDAGYDVADFTTIAPRYGTNADLAELCAAAAERGIAVMLDLVAGHTSDQHPWFAAASDPTAPDEVRHRYVWSAKPRVGWYAPRDDAETLAEPEVYKQAGFGTEITDADPDSLAPTGYYLPNFFPVQPALNFGYARMDPAEPWRQPVDAPGPLANRAALREIMGYWFDLGVSGFRVDMAASLVKDDEGFVETAALWREMREWITREYPGRVLFSEWGNPALSVPNGFHGDFFLQFGGVGQGQALRSLWDNQSGTFDLSWPSYTCWADAKGEGSTKAFVDIWQQARDAIDTGEVSHPYGGNGIVALPTTNHDFTRLVSGTRDAYQARVCFALLLTWPILPTIYYGDEIGMRFLPEVPEKEGSRLGPRYNRAGSRTPMQWNNTGGGMSAYLPHDDADDAPTVESQESDSTSLLNFVRELIAQRHRDPRLRADSPVEVWHHDYPFVYTRGAENPLLIALNPSGNRVSYQMPNGQTLELEPFGIKITETTDVLH